MNNETRKTKWVALALAAVAAAAGATAHAAQPLATPRLLVELPAECNTPDGMCLLADDSIVVAVPNFNDPAAPPLLARITPDNKAEVFHRFATPYPGLKPGVDRIAPMGIARDPASGDLYMADNQFSPAHPRESRLWRLQLRDGKIAGMSLVASGLNIANGVAVHGGHVYLTESTLEQVYNPTMKSAVLRFELAEQNVRIATVMESDPHVLATFESEQKAWPFGADGITFDSKGNLYVGVFSDGVLYKITFDARGKVQSNTVFVREPGRLVSCDGMSCDLKTDRIYLADCAGNAVHVIQPDGRLDTLAKNDDVADVAAKRSGLLDEPSEVLFRGDQVVVANMDWPIDGFVNKKPYRMPATISVIRVP